jgi:chromosome segregation ATPase
MIMKKLIAFIVIIGALFLAYTQVPAFADKVNNVIYSSPCDTPKTYSIGSIDPRFNISKDALLADAEQAASVWKNENGDQILQYDPNSPLTINMIYDQRQTLNNQINNLNTQVQQQKNNLNPEISDYENRVAAFKQKSQDLNSQIESWNAKGGAPEDVYAKLNAEQKDLQQEAAQLQQMASALNQSTDSYNSQIQQLDQTVNSYNQALQYKPEEGLYIRNGTEERIEIYFNNTQPELIHTLEHEMGHAIGLQHNSNPNSIMYPSTTKAVTPSADDLAALADVCQKRSIIQNASTNISYLIASLEQQISSRLNK